MYFSTGAQLQAALNSLPTSKVGSYVAFDPFYYGTTYMQDYGGTLSPIEHFVQIGAARGFSPNADFDPNFYVNQYADLRGKGYDAADLLYHFMQFGLDEGRAQNEAFLAFDGEAYLAQYPDVLAFVQANLAQFNGSLTNGAIAHYVKFGEAEGRNVPSMSDSQTFTLTTSQDSITGGASSDVVYGTITAAVATTTLNPQDTISLGGGTDTVNLTLSGGGYDGSTTISGVEIFNVKAADAQAFDANAMTGVESIVSQRSAATLTVTNIGSAGTKVGFDTITNIAADLSAAFSDAALAGTNDTVSIAITGGVGSSASGAGDNQILITSTASSNGAENLSVAVSGGTAYIGKLESEEGAGHGQVLKKLTVTGSSDLKIATDLDFAAAGGTIDASAFTGNLTVIASDGVDHSITGGSGNDSFDMTTNLTVADTINGGYGTDTVKVNADTVTLASLTLSNIENIYQEATAGNVLSLVTGGSTLTKVTLVENDTTSINLGVTDLAAGVAVELANNVDGQDMGIASLGLKDASGTADALTVSVLGTSGQGDENVEDIAFTNIETLNLVSGSFGTTAMLTTDTNDIDDISADTALTTINASGAANLDVTVGAEATKLTKFDGSAMTATLQVILQAGDVSLTGGSGDDTFAFGSTLNNKDAVIGGGNTKTTTEDTLTATVTSLTATTGALTVSGVERLNLTNAGTAVINATAITGATEIGFVGGGTTTTITGLAAGAAVGLGFKSNDEGGNVAYGTIDVALADSTGTADSLTFNLNNVDTGNAGDAHTATLKTSGIETVNLAYSTTATALASYTVTSTNLKAATINVTGSTADTGNTVALGTVSTSTTKVDGSSFKGVLKATAASGVATTFTTDGTQADSITGSTGADTITISGSAAVSHTIDAGAGSDTLNMTLANGTSSVADMTNIETANFTVSASAAAVLDLDGSDAFSDSDLDVVNISGGNTLSTFAFNTNDQIAVSTISTINASTFNGTTTLAFDDDFLDNTTTVTGGAATGDTITADYDDAITTIDPVVSGFEIIKLTVNADGDDAAEAYTIDTSKITGATRIELNTGATATVGNDVATTLTGLASATTVRIGNATADYENTSTITLTLASATGTADALTVDMYDTEATTVTLVSAGVETLNLSANTSGDGIHTVDLSGVDASSNNTQTINLTGGVATADFTISNVDSTARVINAVDFVGDMVLSDRGSSAMTITGGTGGDTLRMENAADVIDGGADTGDTLVIAQNAVLGGFAVDLSSTVDQVTTYNGSANSAVQNGFLNVNLSGITGSFGSDITANSAGSTITGTSNTDQITGGAGSDTIVVDGTAASADTILGFTEGAVASAGDVLNLSAVLTLDNAAGQSQITDGVFVPVAAATAGAVAFDAGDIVILTGTTAQVGTTTLVAAEFGAGQAFEAVTASDNFIVVVCNSTTGNTLVYEALDGGDTTLSAGELTLIGTLSGFTATDAAALVAANFGL